MIIFTSHANKKFKTLMAHNFSVSRSQVLETIKNPDLIDHSRLPLLIAQKRIDNQHVLRVVFRQESSQTIIITFYPGRSKQYEK